MTVTASVKLQADLTCPGTGLIVDADHVTVDLNRHRLTGAGIGDGISSTGRHGVTVRNGTIRGFRTGVWFGTQSDSRIADVTLSDSETGIFSVEGTGIVMTASRVTGNGLGAGVSGGRGMLVEKTKVTANGSGLVFAASSSGNTLRQNVISGNGTGVSFSESDASVVDNNQILDNGTGVSIFLGRAHTLSANTVKGNTGAGVSITGTDSSGTALVGNKISENRVGAQIGEGGGLVVAAGTTIRGNEFRSNGAAGLLILVTLGTIDGTKVANNTFSGNGTAPGGTLDTSGAIVDDGFHAEVGASAGVVTVTSNTTVANADLGIEVATVTDGGGNTGRSNGDTRQCSGVTCLR